MSSSDSTIPSQSSETDTPICTLTPNQLDILQHTEHRAAGRLYCGEGHDMDVLVAAGLMEYAGRKSFVPDPYYRITGKGREILRARLSPKEGKGPTDAH